LSLPLHLKQHRASRRRRRRHRHPRRLYRRHPLRAPALAPDIILIHCTILFAPFLFIADLPCWLAASSIPRQTRRPNSRRPRTSTEAVFGRLRIRKEACGFHSIRRKSPRTKRTAPCHRDSYRRQSTRLLPRCSAGLDRSAAHSAPTIFSCTFPPPGPFEAC